MQIEILLFLMFSDLFSQKILVKTVIIINILYGYCYYSLALVIIMLRLEWLLNDDIDGDDDRPHLRPPVRLEPEHYYYAYITGQNGNNYCVLQFYL